MLNGLHQDCGPPCSPPMLQALRLQPAAGPMLLIIAGRACTGHRSGLVQSVRLGKTVGLMERDRAMPGGMHTKVSAAERCGDGCMCLSPNHALAVA